MSGGGGSYKKHLFKLYVKDEGVPSIEALQCINNHIDFLKRHDVKVQIIKICASDIDTTLKQELKAKGITKLPSLVPSNGKIRNGVAEIRKLMEIGKQKERDQQRKQNEIQSREYEANFSEDPDLAKLYAREMSLAAIKNDSGDESKFNDDAEDYSRRVAERMRNRGLTMQVDDPTQEMQQGGRRRRTEPEPNYEAPTRPRNTDNNRRQDNRRQEDNRRQDNMPDERPKRNEPRGNTRGASMSPDDLAEQRFMEMAGGGSFE